MNITQYNELDFADMTQEMINEICTTYIPEKEPQTCSRCGCITPNGGLCHECFNLREVEQNALSHERKMYLKTLKSIGTCTVCGKKRVLRRGICEVCSYEVAEEKNRVAMREKYRKSKEYIKNYAKKNKARLQEYARKWSAENYKENAESIKETNRLKTIANRELKCQSLQTA